MMKRAAIRTVLILALVSTFASAGPGSAQSEEQLELWIGQMLMVGFRGTEIPPDHEFRRRIADCRLGGVILFDYDVPSKTWGRNIVSAEQVRRLNRSLQEAARQAGLPPLLIAVDQEGGRISRLKPRYGFPESLSQARLGRIDEEGTTRRQARRTAELLLDLGFNLNFAPVLDLAVHPDNPVIAKLERSFSADPEVVERHGAWVGEEYREAGLLFALKHFPGHGSSRQDSHLGMPDVSEYWGERELEPFARLISRGLGDLVMTAHIFNVNLDQSYPASLSERVIQDILRRRLEFRGAVVTDDLQMGAIVERYSFEKALELAIRAGSDILVIANNSTFDAEVPDKAFRAIRKMVRDGIVSSERIRDSYRRILALKGKLGETE